MATITKRGTGWFAQVRRKGYPAQHKTFRLKSDAQAWARKQEGVIDAGASWNGALSLKGMTLRAILDRYMAEVTPTKRSSDSEKLRLEKLQRDPLCDLDLASLHPHAIASYRDRRLVAVKPGTIRRELSLLHHALDIARREWGYPLPVNPVSLVTTPALNNARDRRLMAGELEQLNGAMDATRNDLVQPIVLFAIESALRRAEIVNLEWRNVDLERRTAHIPWSKTGKARTIPLTDGAVAILRQRLAKRNSENRVFPTTVMALRLAWERLRRRAGLEDLRFHDLRHEAISRFCELGLTLAEVALISGHRDYRMLARYTHLQPMDLAMKLKGKAWGEPCFAT
jgi:integrase